MRKFLVKHWIFLTVGILLTALAVRLAYMERGYIAVGSEWLVIPFMVMVKRISASIREEIKKW